MAWKDSEDKTKIFLDKKISQWAKNNPEFEKIHTNSHFSRWFDDL